MELYDASTKNRALLNTLTLNAIALVDCNEWRMPFHLLPMSGFCQDCQRRPIGLASTRYCDLQPKLVQSNA